MPMPGVDAIHTYMNCFCSATFWTSLLISSLTSCGGECFRGRMFQLNDHAATVLIKPASALINFYVYFSPFTQPSL